MGHYPRQLSGGQEQRVAIARAIVTDPTILVADEPTGDLDAKSAEEILILLTQLKTQFDKTIVMVTHDPRSERFVDAVYRLDKGVFTGAEKGGHPQKRLLAPDFGITGARKYDEISDADFQKPAPHQTKNYPHDSFDCGIALYLLGAGESANFCQPDAR
jgi:ABC-type antimicrobial peptide transport system, ATPase component